MGLWDSLYESSVIAEGDEQLGPYEVQDQELVILQGQLEAAWIVVDLVCVAARTNGPMKSSLR